MPHIHVKPNQHDMTVSAYIVRKVNNKWLCMVHFHKKVEKLMQIGGHIELDETPWQTVAHELQEESGYTLAELDILQPTAERMTDSGQISHPVPFNLNTHNVGNNHYHSDLCFGFVANNLPAAQVTDGESADIRWLTLSELQGGAKNGDVVPDVVNIYEFLLNRLNDYVCVPATKYSLQKPKHTGITYKRGAPGA